MRTLVRGPSTSIDRRFVYEVSGSPRGLAVARASSLAASQAGNKSSSRENTAPDFFVSRGSSVRVRTSMVGSLGLEAHGDSVRGGRPANEDAFTMLDARHPIV